MTTDATTDAITDATTAVTTARRPFAAAAMAGVAVYVAVDVVLQMLPPHYSAISEAESNLAVGPFGWIMNLNFLGRAATTVFAVLAISRMGGTSRLRRAGLALLATGGIASAILAFFPADIHTESHGLTRTSAGAVHLTVATIGFLAALAAVIVLTVWLARVPQLARVRRIAMGCAALATLGLFVLGLSFTVTPEILGLAERICLAGILGWTFVVCAGIRLVPEMSRLQP